MSRAAAVLFCLLPPALIACGAERVPEERIADADPDRGAALIRAYGCPTCHIVPGVRGPRGVVGPSLEQFGRRALIAGIVPNRPDTLVRWVMDPPGLAPDTGMPDMGIPEEEAADIAAFLYTLR
ncbi:c-type cytochrome [Azospirillum sp. ST 5-10]|uniref:c-type cytochrome n=1 Tax=unclassified Azospirillum TaxID=2630922 RepID=UPI003F49D945